MSFLINNIKTFLIDCTHQLARPHPDGEDQGNDNFPPTHVMESRRNFCGKCRHRLWNPEGSNCPGCEKLSPDRGSNNSGGIGSPPRKCREIIRDLVHKISNKIHGSPDINASVHRKLESQSHLISPSSSLNHASPKKRAVLIGITQTNWKYKLKGPVNDANRMKAFLIVQYKFSVNNIRVLTGKVGHLRAGTLAAQTQLCVQEGYGQVFQLTGLGCAKKIGPNIFWAGSGLTKKQSNLAQPGPSFLSMLQTLVLQFHISIYHAVTTHNARDYFLSMLLSLSMQIFNSSL